MEDVCIEKLFRLKNEDLERIAKTYSILQNQFKECVFYKKLPCRLEREFIKVLLVLLGFIKVLSEFLKKFFDMICEHPMDRREFRKHTAILIPYATAVTLAFILLR